MFNPNSPHSGETPLIRRGRVDSLNIYEVKERELELLEKGIGGTLQLNFAIFLFSIALTCIASLATADFKWALAKTIFVIITIVGLIVGSYLMLNWWQTRASLKEVVLTIKSRIDDEPIPDQTQEGLENQSEVPEDDQEPYG